MGRPCQPAASPQLGPGLHPSGSPCPATTVRRWKQGLGGSTDGAFTLRMLAQAGVASCGQTPRGDSVHTRLALSGDSAFPVGTLVREVLTLPS